MAAMETLRAASFDFDKDVEAGGPPPAPPRPSRASPGTTSSPDRGQGGDPRRRPRHLGGARRGGRRARAPEISREGPRGAALTRRGARTVKVVDAAILWVARVPSSALGAAAVGGHLRARPRRRRHALRRWGHRSASRRSWRAFFSSPASSSRSPLTVAAHHNIRVGLLADRTRGTLRRAFWGSAGRRSLVAFAAVFAWEAWKSTASRFAPQPVERRRARPTRPFMIADDGLGRDRRRHRCVADAAPAPRRPAGTAQDRHRAMIWSTLGGASRRLRLLGGAVLGAALG